MMVGTAVLRIRDWRDQKKTQISSLSKNLEGSAFVVTSDHSWVYYEKQENKKFFFTVNLCV